MASNVEIANLALTKLGAERIVSFDDPSKEARALTAIYDLVRDDELRRHRWNFAFKRASLAALPDAPEWGYTLQYELPSDCLRVDQVGEYFESYLAPGIEYRGGPDMPYQIEGRRILTDIAAPLVIRYIYRVTDSGQFDASFVEALACRLAAQLAEDLSQSTGKGEQARKDYQSAIAWARRVSAIEKPPEDPPDNAWLMARL